MNCIDLGCETIIRKLRDLAVTIELNTISKKYPIDTYKDEVVEIYGWLDVLEDYLNGFEEGDTFKEEPVEGCSEQGSCCGSVP